MDRSRGGPEVNANQKFHTDSKREEEHGPSTPERLPKDWKGREEEEPMGKADRKNRNISTQEQEQPKQKQKDKEHCIRRRRLQQQEDHGPDTLERHLEEWMDQEEMPVEKADQQCHMNSKREEEHDSDTLERLLGEWMGQEKKPENRADQKKTKHRKPEKGTAK